MRRLNSWVLQEVIVGLVVLAIGLVYWFTRAPSIGWIDSGALGAAAASLGIANPPGFPSYMVLAHLWLKLPFGTVLDRLQALSLVGAVGLIWLVSWWVKQICDESERLARWSFVARLAIAVIFGFSYTLWSQATNVETFTLTNFLAIFLVWGAWKFREVIKKTHRISWRPLLGLTVVSGVAVGFNPTISAVVPSALWWGYQILRQSSLGWQRWRLIFAVFLAIFLVGGVYSYLPLRALQHPAMNWGDPSTPQRFLDHLHGAGLNIFEPATGSINGFTGSPVVWYRSFETYVQLLILQFTPLWFPVAFLGLRWMWRQKSELVWLMLPPVLINLLYVILYFGGNRESWMLTSWSFMAVWLGVGVAVLMHWIDEHKIIKTPITLFLLGLLSLIPGIFWLRFLNQRTYSFGSDFTKNLLLSVPENAVVIGGGDLFNSYTNFTQIAEGTRPDIVFITGNMFYIFPWYRDQVRAKGLVVSDELEKKVFPVRIEGVTEGIDQLVADNPTRKFFITPLLLRESMIAGTAQGVYVPERYQIIPHGLLLEIVSSDLESPQIEFDQTAFNFAFSHPLPKHEPFYLEQNYRTGYLQLMAEYADAWFRLAELQESQEQIAAARQSLQNAVLHLPDQLYRQWLVATVMQLSFGGDIRQGQMWWEKAAVWAPNDLRVQQIGQMVASASAQLKSEVSTSSPYFSMNQPKPISSSDETSGTASDDQEVCQAVELASTEISLVLPSGWQKTVRDEHGKMELFSKTNKDVRLVLEFLPQQSKNLEGTGDSAMNNMFQIPETMDGVLQQVKPISFSNGQFGVLRSWMTSDNSSLLELIRPVEAGDQIRFVLLGSAEAVAQESPNVITSLSSVGCRIK